VGKVNEKAQQMASNGGKVGGSVRFVMSSKEGVAIPHT